MSTPTIQAPAPLFPPPPAQARLWFTKKRFILPITAAVFLAIGSSVSGNSTTETPTPAVTVAAAPVTVTTAPAECGTALDFAAEFATAVGTEHSTMGAAFTKAGTDGDVLGAFTAATAAANTLNAKIDKISAPMSAAVQVCRASIK
jgi:hypothetical protein